MSFIVHEYTQKKKPWCHKDAFVKMVETTVTIG